MLLKQNCFVMRLHEKYKNDLSAFVYASRKQFSPQKTKHSSQVKHQASKKRSRNRSPFCSENSFFFEKIWCNESAATNNPKRNETFSQGLPELKDLA